jgi:hypothetical protein
LARKQTKRAALPVIQLLAESRALREHCGNDPKVVAIFNAVEAIIADGWTVRRGPFEPRQAPLHEAWGGKEPPERP